MFYCIYDLFLSRISDSDAVKLIKSFVPHVSDDRDVSRVVGELPRSFMAVALAGATIKVYRLLLEGHGHDNPTAVSLDKYLELLKEETCEERRMDRMVSLYLEAASSYDPLARHGFDFIASFGNVQFPIPVSAIAQHLSDPFYTITPPVPPNDPALVLPSMEPPMEPPRSSEPDAATNKAMMDTITSTVTSYFKQLKSLLNFQKSDVPPVAGTSQHPVDGLGTLRESPLLTFQSQAPGGIETLRVHCAAFPQLGTQFISQTVPRLEQNHLAQAEDHFNKTAWFKSYRPFNASQTLRKYMCSLPGVSAPGVATEESFKKNPDRFSAVLHGGVVGCRPRGESVTYSQYLHLVSHYHRVTESLNQELKSATGDLEDVRLKVSLKPLFQQVAQYPLLSIADKLICSSALTSIEASITSEYATQLRRFESLLGEQKCLFGSKSPSVSRTLAEMADLKYSMKDFVGAKELLSEALSIHRHLQSIPAERNKHFLDLGLTLSSLGIVCSSLGERQQSKSYLEQALATYQTVPDDGNVTKRQRKLVASTLIDLSHAYLILGQLIVAKKHVELAVDAAKAVYGEKHPEVARALNVKSIACAMLGDKEQSRKLRQEAGGVLGGADS